MRNLSIRDKIRQSRAFFFALLAVAVIWTVTMMSDKRHYRESYVICFDGVDTSKYAVTDRDSLIVFDITSNGFHALSRSLHGNHELHADVSKLMNNDSVQKIAIRIADQLELFSRQIDMRGVEVFQPVTEQVSMAISKRECRAYHPDISKVEFQFDGMTGLCGSPVISPDSVYLYGSRSSLDKIERLSAKPQVLRQIRHSGKYNVQLDPVWRSYPDLRVGSQTIQIYLPVDTFIEKKMTLPVVFNTEGNAAKENTSESVKRVQLYPSEVTLTCLVPKKSFNKVNATDFFVTTSQACDTVSFLYPIVSRFPANVRVKSIDPPEIQYILIK